MNQALHLSGCLSLLVVACSGSIEAVNANRATSTAAGSGGSSGVVGAGGNTAGVGTSSTAAASSTAATGSTATSSTAGASGSSGSSGSGGQGGRDVPEGGIDTAEAGMDPAEGGTDAAQDGPLGRSGDAAPRDAGPIDYSIWALQLPTGSGTSPTTIPPSQLATFSNIYFYRADDGGQVFMSPAQGVTTPNSTRCRTELRESGPGGGQAAWSPSGTNTMTVTGKVLQGGGITVAQVFNGGDGITLGELQYSSGGFTLFYEEARGQGSSTGLGNRTALNTPFTFTMGFSKNVLTVTINGQEVYRRTPSAGILGSTFYFKVGNYDQTTSRGTPGTTPHSIVEDYSVVVVHQ